ncbi:ATP-binding protein [Clostridium sp.]|jgi:ABC-type cobalamin/Fe3+-siderophores transport system ATPase subunit|uniref:ATP-binding protein n=1 Tax=Clostridium sp. TaxID=1506 RepID=UPI002585F9EB|nr:ATP-binding protein [Clostridium sp.]MDF2503678.1 ATPase family protein associated with various cellular [Clostridium sp.]
MNFNEALMCAELVIESGEVPLLIGESGIGKTTIIKRICANNNYYSINIDGNMLKEGEIGGLPTIEDYEINLNGEKVKLKRTVYAVHTKLQEIERVLSNDPNKTILLFIDEINRCEHSVQQELMNIILNREINGFKMPRQVKVIAAMNPSSKYGEYNQTDYQVVDMDAAQEDRFVWIEVESDTKAWISWGMEKIDGYTNIHEDILNFISTFPEYLHTPFSTEMIKATPRSWERVSNVYKVYLEKEEKVSKNIIYNVIKGNVGGSIAQEFMNFINSNNIPIITPEEIFFEGILKSEVIEKIKKENHSRLYLIAKNVFQYIEDSKNKKQEVDIFSRLLQYYPPDLKLAIMKELKEIYEDSIYKEFLLNKNFIEGFFSIYSDFER